MLTAALAPGAAGSPTTNPVSPAGCGPFSCGGDPASWGFGFLHQDSFGEAPGKRGSRTCMAGREGHGSWEHLRSLQTLPQVILVVDEVLETQDLNGDGLMTPAELVNFPGEAPRHAEPTEALEPQDAGGQPLLAKSPSRQEAHEALGPRENAGEQVEARRESLEPVQEAGGQAEAEREAPGPGGEFGEQVEARDTGEGAEELPGETLGSQNPPHGFEAHAVQLENDEI